MPSVTRLRRSTVEVSGELEKAREMLRTIASDEGYLRTKCLAVADACLWVLGERAAAPVTGEVLEPTDDALVAEMLRGEADEPLRRREGGDAVTPGAAAHLLSWVLLDPDTEAPL